MVVSYGSKKLLAYTISWKNLRVGHRIRGVVERTRVLWGFWDWDTYSLFPFLRKFWVLLPMCVLHTAYSSFIHGLQGLSLTVFQWEGKETSLRLVWKKFREKWSYLGLDHMPNHFPGVGQGVVVGTAQVLWTGRQRLLLNEEGDGGERMRADPDMASRVTCGIQELPLWPVSLVTRAWHLNGS